MNVAAAEFTAGDASRACRLADEAVSILEMLRDLEGWTEVTVQLEAAVSKPNQYCHN
jgi:hypothetical protein